MPVTSDELALLAAIEASPDDDALRLAYADALDEAAGARNEPTPCPRAELIRVQVERTAIQSPVLRKCTGEDDSTVPDPLVMRHAELGRQEHDILFCRADDFRFASVCAKCNGEPFTYGNGSSRGVACMYCFQSGDAGGLLRRSPIDGKILHKVTWHRGFPRVHCTLAECVKEVADHDNNCRSTVPSDWLRAVVTHHRGVEVWVTDREPFHCRRSYENSKVNDEHWRWWMSGAHHAPPHNVPHSEYTIPLRVFNHLSGGEPAWKETTPDHWCLCYSSADAAHTALARAIPTWCRTFLS